MPSEKHLKEKQSIVDEIKEKLEKAQSAIVVDYRGISVAQADSMRRKLREANIDYKIYKNTMMSRAIKGTSFSALEDQLSGPSAFAFGYEDAIAPARVLNNAIKEFKVMEFKGGVVEGQAYDAAGIKAIATLPSRDELLAKFLGSIKSPITKFAYTLQAIADQKAE